MSQKNCVRCHSYHMSDLHSLRCNAGDLPNGTPAGASPTAAAAAARGRCRAVVMLQRLVGRLHEAHAARMPPPLALQLVGVLQVWTYLQIA